jgi:putative FmdB family regulatory protein
MSLFVKLALSCAIFGKKLKNEVISMPLHDFLCRGCGHAFEALVMGAEQPVCPQCGGTELTRQMSTFASRTSTKGGSGSSGGSKCSGCAGGSCSTCH